MLNTEIIEKIKKNSVSLENYGIDNLAWNKESAQQLIHSIENEKIGILGGDIYRLTTKLEPLSDNWSCEPNKLETEESFYARGKKESLNYIENYPVEEGENILFSIIFTEQI